MAKKNSMKRALIFGATSMALTASMFVGTTFAWFTDSVTSNNNVIKSGNLDVELYYQNDETSEWTKVTSGTNVFKKDTLWEPGHTEVVKLKVVNEGSLALKYQLGVNIASEVGSVNVAGKKFNLSDYIQYGIVNGDNDYATRAAAIQAAEDVKATRLNVAYNSGTQTLVAAKNATETLDEKDVVTMVVYMPTTVGNEANPAKDAAVPTINLGINLLATQETYEEDSKGNDYDKDAWVDGFEVGTANDLQAALNNGVTNFVLKNDIVATEMIVIPAPTVATMSTRTTNATVIDLNGYTIKGTMVKPNHVINNKGTLIIEGGTISSTAANGGSAIANYGTLTVKGTNINGASIREDGNWPSYPVNNYGDMTLTDCIINGYQGGVANNANATAVINNVTIVKNYLNTSSHAFYNGGTLTINGGTYSNNGMDGSVLYNYDSGNVTINGGTFSASAGGYGPAILSNSTMKINGGTFNCGLLDWGGSAVISGGTFSSQPNAKFLSAGYTTAKNADNTYTVYFPQESVEDLFDNATENATVEIPAGNYSFPAGMIEAGMTVECAEGTVFSGTSSLNVKGATVVGATFKNVNGQAVSGTVNGTFVDCTFDGSETLRWCYTTADTTTVFENCVIKTDFRGFHFDEMNGDVIFRNCEINGFNAYSGTGTVTFENCKFGSDRSRYNGLNIYTNTNLVNCTFDFKSGKTNFIDMEGTGKTLNIQNCTATLNGNAVPVESFVGGSKIDNNTVVVDGVRFVKSSAMLKAAIEANVEKVLLADGDYSLRFTNHTNYNVDNMTITGIGENVTLSISSSEAWYGRIQGNNVTFENIKFEGTVGATGKATYNNCTFSGRLECASSGQADTYVNNCTVNVFHTSVDLNSGNAYVKNSTITGTEYSGGKTMYFEECTIGELISWNTSTVLTNCTVTTLDASHMTTNAIIMDGKVLVVNEDSFASALNGNGTEVVLSMGAGEYKLPSFGGAKEITIVGTKDTVIDNTLGSYMEAAKVSFEGVTIKGSTGMANGNGSDYAALYCSDVTYTNCTFDGPFRIGRDGAKFINCKFTNLGNDYVWTYGNDVEFIGCTFETAGKAILIYSDGGNEVSKVTVKNCVFNATQGAKAGAISNQNCAAIEIHNYGNGVNLVTEGNTVGANFSGEWRIKTYENGKPAITVNGVTYTQTAFDGVLMTVTGTVATWNN